MKFTIRRAHLPVLVLCSAVFLFYGWISTLGFEGSAPSYYNLQTDALLAGRLHIEVAADPALVKDQKTGLPNWPYINANNLQEFSFYKERFYLYFGVTPTLTLFLPYRLLSHGARLDERWAVLIFGFGGFLWSLALLRYLCKKYFSGASGRSVAFAGWILGFANYIPMLLRPHCVYEVAVSSGFFFLAGSLYFLSSAFAAEKPSYKKIAWGSLFLGLAAGSRPHFLILSFLLLAVTLFRLSPKDPAKKDYFRSLGALLAPFLAFFCFWMSYNYLRFENVFEAGAAYIPMNPGNYLFHPLLAVPNSYFFLFRPPRLDSYFPYLHLQNEFPDFMRFAHSWYRVIENSVGLLPSVPFAGLLLVSPYAFRNAAKNSTINLRDLLSDFALILFPAAIGLPIFLCFWSVCNRYFADFASFLILSATVVWLTVDACLTNNSGTRNKFRFLVIFLGLISIFSGIIYAVDFRGYNLDHFYLWARS